MIRSYHSDTGPLTREDGRIADALWLDILSPTPQDEAQVEAALGLDVPTREEMDEIEVSSRLYLEGDVAYLTALVPAQSDGDDPLMAPVTFVLTAEQLITVRYHSPTVFDLFPARAAKTARPLPTAAATLLALLDAIIDRQADILERAGREIDTLSRQIFRNTKGIQPDFQKTLEEIGRKGDLIAKIRDSLLTQERLFGFLATHSPRQKALRDSRDAVKTLVRDARSLTDHANALSNQITFLLDATLGMITIQQNATIKIFSVAAVIFLPPTLVASIYGMNFTRMPELGLRYGYPGALGLMVLFAVLPYLYFKYRKWL